MGSEGAAIAAANGRYFWPAVPDHPNVTVSIWADAVSFYGGFSNDPGVPPQSVYRLFYYWGGPGNSIVRTGTTTYGVYQLAWLLYNPDDTNTPKTPFYLYSEGQDIVNASLQHMEGVSRSADLVNWTLVGPSHPNIAFNDWSSFQRVVRVGASNFYSFGFAVRTAAPKINGGAFGSGVWTSTDGLTFAPPTTQANVMIGNRFFQSESTDEVMIGGQKWVYGLEGDPDNNAGYVTRWAVDSAFNVLSSPAPVRIAGSFAGLFPGPSHTQSVAAYHEDGITHIYLLRGFYPSKSNLGTETSTYYATPAKVTATIATTVMTVTTIWPGSGPIVLGMLVNAPAGNIAIASFGTGTGGIGTYNLASPTTVTTPTQMFVTAGGLNEEMIEYITEITDAASASAAAPVGVTASCNTGTVTVQCLDVLPKRTYRLYRGATASSQATLIGDVNGLSITDSPSAGQQWWYKLVTLNGATETQGRIVSTYASSANARVNQHINRVINDGGDVTKIDQAWLASVDSWLATNGLYSSLMMWADPSFGVKVNGGGAVLSVYDYGCSRLSRVGDLIPIGTSMTYNAMDMNGHPALLGNSTCAVWGGGGRFNHFRRKHQVSIVAAYQKLGSPAAALFGHQQFKGVSLLHDIGPDTVKFALSDATQTKTATISITSPNAIHVIGGVFDGTNAYAYADGTQGTAQSGLVIPKGDYSTSNDTLTGVIAEGAKYTFPAYGSTWTSYTAGGTYDGLENRPPDYMSDVIVFEVGLTPTQMASLSSLIRTRLGV